MADGPSYQTGPSFFGPGGAWSMHPSYRASDADREQLVDVLKGAFTEGRLSQDEYTGRMERAYTAVTYGDLKALAGDLPPGPPPMVPFTPYQPPMRTNSLAVASLVLGLATPIVGITAIPAVITGHRARQQIRRTGERGTGLALTGLVIGWTAIAMFVLLVVLAVLVGISTAHGGTSLQGQGTVNARLLPSYHRYGPVAGHPHH